MIINMNDRVRVVLTETGVRVWNEGFECIPIADRPMPKVAGEPLDTQLWNLIQAFGPAIYMGMEESPIRNNDITLLYETTVTLNPLLKRQAG